MMLDIFSSFDPFINYSYQKYPTLFWGFILTALALSQSAMWLSPSKYFWGASYLMDIMYSQTLRTQGTYLKGFASLITPLFLLIILTNFMGLLPYVFSFSSHLIMTIPLGLTLWLSLLLSGALYAPTSFTAGLLPGGAPDWLNPFLVLVETLSILVRPITLSFRLAANMTAGHIILGLIGVYASAAAFSSTTSMIVLLAIQTGYILFEVGICLIQAYIFCLLLTLYADEHPAH